MHLAHTHVPQTQTPAPVTRHTMTPPTHDTAPNSPQALIDDYARRCGSFGEVTRVSLFCHHERPRMILCSVYMEGGATEAADAVNGHAMDRTVCSFHPVSPAFNCGNHKGASLKIESCIDCNVSLINATRQVGQAAHGSSHA